MNTVAHQAVYSAADLAAFCGTDVGTIYAWVRKGSIEHYRTPAGHLRFEREAVLEFLRRHGIPIPRELRAAG